MKSQAHVTRHALHGQRSRRASQDERGDTAALAPLAEQYLHGAGAASNASAQRPGSPRRRVAVFGFSPYRVKHAAALKKEEEGKKAEDAVYIDTFNKALGLEADLNNPFFSRYFDLMRALQTAAEPKYYDLTSIAEKDFGAQGEMEVQQFEAYVGSWVAYMRQARGRLDIQQKLKDMVTHSRWRFWGESGETRLQRFIFKNSAGSVLPIERRKELLKTFASAKSADELEKSIDEYEWGWLKKVVSNAFFRETSKLGLSWFSENKEAMNIDRIDFIVNDYDAFRRKELAEAVQAKPYRSLGAEDEGRMHEAITYSEYRYALRKRIELNPLMRRPGGKR